MRPELSRWPRSLGGGLPIFYWNRSSAAKGYAKIASKFRDDEDYGPTCVREFVEGTGNLDDRTPAQWQTDAFGQVRAFLEALGL